MTASGLFTLKVRWGYIKFCLKYRHQKVNNIIYTNTQCSTSSANTVTDFGLFFTTLQHNSPSICTTCTHLQCFAAHWKINCRMSWLFQPCIIQPESRYSFCHPTDGRKRNRLRHHGDGIKLELNAIYHNKTLSVVVMELNRQISQHGGQLSYQHVYQLGLCKIFTSYLLQPQTMHQIFYSYSA